MRKRPDPITAPAASAVAAAPAAATMFIYGHIGKEVLAAAFVKELAGIKAGTINVHLNTPGGLVTDGIAIYNALRSHPARVVTHIDGVAASIGSVIALAGDEVRMADNALLMIHNPLCAGGGSAQDLRATADMLDKMTDQIVSTYVRSSGRSADECRAWMDAETWFSAAEAKAAGFVDVIYDAPALAAQFDLNQFHNVPAALRGASNTTQTQETPDMPQSPQPESNPTPPAEAPQQPAAPATPPAPAVPAQPATPPADAPETPDAETSADVTPPAQARVTVPDLTGVASASELMAAFPGDKGFCMDQLVANATMAQAHAAYNKVVSEKLRAAEARAAQAEAALAIETASPAPIRTAGATAASAQARATAAATDTSDPKAVASAEWDDDVKNRAGFSSKENYVNYRAAELSGRMRVFSLPPGTQPQAQQA